MAIRVEVGRAVQSGATLVRVNIEGLNEDQIAEMGSEIDQLPLSWTRETSSLKIALTPSQISQINICDLRDGMSDGLRMVGSFFAELVWKKLGVHPNSTFVSVTLTPVSN